MSTHRAPPHPAPDQRDRPLPQQQPKPATEDPAAPRRVEEILESPSYRIADQDPDFLGREDTRGLRLHVDYLKPELLLREQDIRHTIVVFGGTRIHEPAAAAREVAACRIALAADPGNADLQQQLSVAERRAAKAHYYEVAREFGARVSLSGEGPEDCRLVVMTGGGPGIMEAANRGAFDVGAKSVGLNIDLPREQFPNPYITPDLCFRFHYFAIRKLHFVQRARALVAFPGGYGTLDELFETLTLVQTRRIHPVPVVLVGEQYWRRVIDFDFLVDEGLIDPEDRDLFWYAETADDIWDGIRRWHEENGTGLFPCA